MGIPTDDLLAAFESHDAGRIRAILDAGLDVRAPIRGQSPVSLLVEMYARSDRFPACLRLLLDRGAVLDDPVLEPVLLGDADALGAAIRKEPALIGHRVSMRCDFTPLDGATLLHVAAEYGHVHVARRLLELGAPVDARSATDDAGLNGHTALFHTVNSNANRSAPVMVLLLQAGARADVLLKGITWGRGFDWETTLLDVTPASYAQMGLLPQMHRAEADVYANLRALLEAGGRKVPEFANVPNRYLRSP